MQITITAAQLTYLAGLVDWETSGNQDDPLYLELMELWNTLDDGDTVLLQKANDSSSISQMRSLNVLSTEPKVSPNSPLPKLRNRR